MKVLKGKQGGPRRVLFHGTNWIGKTTFASQAFGGCLLANLEDDRDVDMDKSPPIRSWDDWAEFYTFCDSNAGTDAFPYRWIAVDTIDSLQHIIEKKICNEKGVESMADDKFSFGKGNKLVEAMWQKVKFQLDWLHTERGLGIILLAHSEAVKMTPPDAASYERWEPAVCEYARDILCDWCQEVFFGSFRNYTREEDAGFNRTRNIAAGGIERFVRTTPTAGIRAKNRLNMKEDEITNFTFNDYAKCFIPDDVLNATKG